MTNRIRLDDMTDDQLEALYAELDTVRADKRLLDNMRQANLDAACAAVARAERAEQQLAEACRLLSQWAPRLIDSNPVLFRELDALLQLSSPDAALDGNRQPETARQDGHTGATRATEATHGETPTEPTNGPHTRVQRRCGDCDCFDPDTCPYPSPTQAADHIRATVTDEHGQHRYLSTYCVHHDCGQCRRTCKHCGTPCLCGCHHGHL